ncbi:MAG: lytic murein transglycosylase [Candidatus Campbellbacteria bacterium]|nr:lytic murein transglycosylase [Candidatus Campbellbacteria bacterium]
MHTANAHTHKERVADLTKELSVLGEEWVTDIFNHKDVCSEIEVPQPRLRAWNELRNEVLSDVSQTRGELFFLANGSLFTAAGKTYAKDDLLPYVILAIPRIESNLGENRAGTPVIATLFKKYERVVDGPSGNKRRNYIKEKEIIPFLQMAKTNEWDVCLILGTRAAAFGYPHFIPESLRLAVDGDDDGKIDLMWSLADATRSIAHYLHKTGWSHSNTRAVFRYNPDPKYVQIVLEYAYAIKKRVPV